MKLKQILIAGTLLGGVYLAEADERTFGDGTLPEFLQEYDVNEDGKLDEEERQALRDTRRERARDRRALIDADGDGKITRDEIQAAREALRERIAEKRSEKFTEVAGPDERLSLAEFSAIPVLERVPEERLASLFARLDADESGFVDLDEFIARLRPTNPPAPPRPGAGHDRPDRPNLPDLPGLPDRPDLPELPEAPEIPGRPGGRG